MLSQAVQICVLFCSFVTPLSLKRSKELLLVMATLNHEVPSSRMVGIKAFDGMINLEVTELAKQSLSSEQS